MIAPPGALLGTLVRLRPLNRSDAAHFTRWYADPALLHWLHLSEGPPVTPETWLMAHERGVEDASIIAWMIEVHEGSQIGHLGLNHIDPVHFRAELYIAIGEQSHWGKGYGSDAIRLVLRYGFEHLDLRRIELITDADNERGIRCYEKCGFVQEGLLRQHRLRYGKPLDMLQMAVLRQDWEAACR